MDRASSLAFQTWPCQWASIRQKRPRASGATLEPRPGMSRSRKVRVKERIHRVHASGERASPGAGEAAAHPEAVQVGRSHLPEGKAGHVHVQDAPRESLRNPRCEIPGGAAQEKKDGLAIRVVGDRPERLEQPR